MLERSSSTASERTPHMRESHGQILALALSQKFFQPVKLFPVRSEKLLVGDVLRRGQGVGFTCSGAADGVGGAKAGQSQGGASRMTLFSSVSRIWP